MALTAQRLREVLRYEPETGAWRWAVASGRSAEGSIAGSIDKDTGYRYIQIDGRKYLSARLAWFWMTGEWPPNMVDHKNTRKLDDRWSNLRLSTNQQNQANRGISVTNTSGLKGVGWHRLAKKWRSEIKIDGVSRHLGTFDCPVAAHLTYIVAADRAFGEFARAS